MNKKRILLVNSYVRNKEVESKMLSGSFEEPYPSVGILSLSSNLKKNGYDVLYLDIPAIIKQKIMGQNGQFGETHVDDLIEKIIAEAYKDFKPDLAALSCLFSGKFSGTIFGASIIKKMSSTLPVVIGGIHPTIFHKEIIERIDTVDFVVIGEGEKSFVDLLNSYFFSKVPFSEIDGLCYRDNGKVIVNPKINFINDLDNYPMPDYDVLDMSLYEIEPDKWEDFWHNPLELNLRYRWPLLTSRSCPMKCNFCAMNLVHGPKIRFRSARKVFEEIEYLYEEFGINYFSIIDDNFTLDKNRVIELAEHITNKNMKIYIDTPNGISMKFFDKEILEALKAMGLLRAYFAIESGSDFIRNEIMGKNLSNEKIYEVSEMMKNEQDIFLRAFFIVGLPQETTDTLEETWKMINNLYLDDVAISFAVPFPGTRLYDEVKKEKLLVIPEKDVLFAENYQLASDTPFIRPHNLGIKELISFKAKVNALYSQRYKNLNMDRKYPIHHLLQTSKVSHGT